MTEGFVQVYTGEGKGKTTAALGLCLRALGAGLSVYFGQFLKGRPSAELASLEALAGLPGARLRVSRFGTGRFLGRTPGPEDLAAAAAGLAEAREELASGGRDLVVLDEACVALSRGLLPRPAFEALLEVRPAGTELVLTGRGAPAWLIERADLVTELRAVKHYFDRGVAARRGIEC